MYNAASAVLLNELLKGAISLSIAFRNAVHGAHHPSSALERGDYARLEMDEKGRRGSGALQGGLGAGESIWSVDTVSRGGRKMFKEVFRCVFDCFSGFSPPILVY
jgi:hypothetical protein